MIMRLYTQSWSENAQKCHETFIHMKILKISANFQVLSLIAFQLVVLQSDCHWLYPAEVSESGGTRLEILNSAKLSKEKTRPKILKKKEISFLLWNVCIVQFDWHCFGTSYLLNFHVQRGTFFWGTLAFFSFPTPSLYSGPDAWQKHADSCTLWSEHKILVTFWITNATVECDVTSLWGEASSPACSSNAVVGFTASSEPSECYKDLLRSFA